MERDGSGGSALLGLDGFVVSARVLDDASGEWWLAVETGLVPSLWRAGGRPRTPPGGGARKRSRRAIPLPRSVVQVLRAHREAQSVERAGAELWADHDLVFTTSIGTPIEPRNLNRHFDALREGAGVRKVRFHDLRHSCASLLFELGVPLRMVMEILGHSQISTTSDIYTHVMPAQFREVADALDTWLESESQGREAGD